MMARQAGIVMTSVEPEEIFEDLAVHARETQSTDDAWDVCFWDSADGLTDMYGNMISLDEQGGDDDMSALGLSSGGPRKVGITDTLEFMLNMARQRQLAYDTGETANQDNFKMLVVRNADRLLMPSQARWTLLWTYLQKIIEPVRLKDHLCASTAPSWDLPLSLVHFEYIEHDLPNAAEREYLSSMGITDISEPVCVRQQVLAVQPHSMRLRLWVSTGT